MSPTNKLAADDLNPPPSNAGTLPLSAAIIDDSGDDGWNDEMPDIILLLGLGIMKG